MQVSIKKKIFGAGIFVLGVLVTIFFTKLSDKIYPNDPVIIKQVTDTITIVHKYNVPNEIENDTLKLQLENKIKNIELLNNYDQEIEKRILQIESKSSSVPNLIITKDMSSIINKGYTYGSSSSFFSSLCPSLNSKFIDINFVFFNPLIIKEIAFVKVNIYKFEEINDKEARNFVLEEFYEPKINNFIRINNDLEKGKYEIIYGFMLKSNLNKEFPVFYFKKCILFQK